MDKSGRITLPAGLTVCAFWAKPPPKSEFGLPVELLLQYQEYSYLVI